MHLCTTTKNSIIQTEAILFRKFTFFNDHILLSASMGCIFAALRAGYIPKNTPIAVENPTAITIVENFISIGIFI